MLEETKILVTICNQNSIKIDDHLNGGHGDLADLYPQMRSGNS
jgi:hypothetical protein